MKNMQNSLFFVTYLVELQSDSIQRFVSDKCLISESLFFF